MKTVFSSNSQVSHVWASQTQSSGRAGSMFFQDTKIYSYGYHFLAAEIHTNSQGEKLVLINENTYSNSTAKHLSEIRRALRNNIKSLEVPNPGNLNSPENELYLMNAIVDVLADGFNSRTRYSSESGLTYRIETLNQFLSFRDGKKAKLFKLDDDTAEVFRLLTLEKDQKQAERNLIKNDQRIERQKQYEIEQAKLAKEYEQEVALWSKNQNTKHIPSRFFKTGFDMIRIASNGNEVETSAGARVPLTHAKRLMGLVIQNRVKVGDRVGHFTVDSINAKTLKIGCHVIDIEQAKEVLGSSPALKVVE